MGHKTRLAGRTPYERPRIKAAAPIREHRDANSFRSDLIPTVLTLTRSITMATCLGLQPAAPAHQNVPALPPLPRMADAPSSTLAPPPLLNNGHRLLISNGVPTGHWPPTHSWKPQRREWNPNKRSIGPWILAMCEHANPRGTAENPPMTQPERSRKGAPGLARW